MSTATIDSQRVMFQRGLAASSISDKGFADVSIIEGNREALGHGIFIDGTGLDQLVDLLMGKSIPAYITHDGAAYGDRITKEIGMFSGFYRDGDKIKAKQFTFFESFKNHNREEMEKLVELAEKMPEQMGVSIVFNGTAVWVDAEGEETPGYLPEPEGAQYGMPVVRFASIESADFVKKPAANSGLFSIRKPDEGQEVDASAESMEQTTVTLDAHNEALSSKDAELETIKGELAEKSAEVVALTEKHAEEVEALKADHEQAFAASEEAVAEALAAKEAAEANVAELEQFDARKLGVAPVAAAPAEEISLPAPAATDAGKWSQYAELRDSDEEAAAMFKEKYLSNRFRIVNL